MTDLVTSSLLFSLSFGLIKAEVAGLDPWFVAFVRLALSFLAFAPFLRRVRAPMALELGAIGFVQFGVMYGLYIASFRHLAGHQVAMLTTTTPIYVVAIDALFAGRVLRRAFLAGLLAIGAGLILVFDTKALSVSLGSFALVQVANLCFALGQVLYARARRRNPVERDFVLFGWLYLGALVAPCLGLLFVGHVRLPGSARAWFSLAYLGLVPSALGFFLWNRGVSRVSAATAAVMNNLKVPLGVLLAWLLFGESIVAWRVGASGALMALALLVARRQ